jgi:hypothetical protein
VINKKKTLEINKETVFNVRLQKAKGDLTLRELSVKGG